MCTCISHVEHGVSFYRSDFSSMNYSNNNKFINKLTLSHIAHMASSVDVIHFTGVISGHKQCVCLVCIKYHNINIGVF